MTRIPIPFSASDISSLAKSLRAQLAERSATPSHVELLNMLARSVGSRNYQQFRARAIDGNSHSPRPAPVAQDVVDLKRVQAARRHFDARGRLLRWPARQTLQHLSLWVLWASFPPRRGLSEAQVKVLLSSRHTFGDHALLRRALCDHGLLSRTADGRDYRRIERKPPAEAAALIRELNVAAAGEEP